MDRQEESVDIPEPVSYTSKVKRRSRRIDDRGIR